jgi:hypothetical protein
LDGLTSLSCHGKVPVGLFHEDFASSHIE